MIDMYDIIAGRELVQLLQRQREFSTSCFIAFQVEFMKAVEQLVIREKADTQGLIGKTFMNVLLTEVKGMSSPRSSKMALIRVACFSTSLSIYNV